MKSTNLLFIILKAVFWDDLKEIFVNSLREAKEIGHLSTSQRQAIIKIIEKNRDKRFIRNWRLIFLLNVDSKYQKLFQRN